MATRKRTKGLQAGFIGPSTFKEPTPQERVERSTEMALRDALDADPAFKRTVRAMARQIRSVASKLLRGLKDG